MKVFASMERLSIQGNKKFIFNPLFDTKRMFVFSGTVRIRYDLK